MQKFRLHLLISSVQVQSNHNDDNQLMINISADLALRLPFIDKKKITITDDDRDNLLTCESER